MSEFDIIINTTPLGMAPDIDKTPLDASLLRENQTVFDIVYSPHETRFIRDARDRGCHIVYGIEMLLFQGVRQFEIWTSEKAPVDGMREILEEHTGKV